MNDLDAQLLAAHAEADAAALVTLYAQASDMAAHLQAKRFFLTHAYVYALELGHPDVATLKSRLNLL